MILLFILILSTFSEPVHPEQDYNYNMAAEALDNYADSLSDEEKRILNPYGYDIVLVY